MNYIEYQQFHPLFHCSQRSLLYIPPSIFFGHHFPSFCFSICPQVSDRVVKITGGTLFILFGILASMGGRKFKLRWLDSPQTSSLWHLRCVNILECLVTAVFDVAQPRSCQEFLAGFGNAQNRPHGCVARNAVDRVNKNGENAACSSRSSNPQIATS